MESPALFHRNRRLNAKGRVTRPGAEGEEISMIKKDYAKLMEEELASIAAGGRRPRLLLHLCCAPCSSYVVELLAPSFHQILYFYDPNIHPYEEYVKRRDEAARHAGTMGIEFIEGPYDVDRWRELTTGREEDPERGQRCSICYEMRLEEAARFAGKMKCEYFATVLSISPHKDAGRINEIGYKLSEKYGVRYLPADFKKRDGFKKSMELSRRHGFYRQNYCGCLYSMR